MKTIFGDEYKDGDRIPLALYSFLVQSQNRNILVDLGPKSVEYTNDMFRRYGFFRTSPEGPPHPDDIIQKHGNLLVWLAKFDLTPADISDIIFTHLHGDHHGLHDGKDGGLCEDFPNSTFHVSEKGWKYNLSQRKNDHWNSYLDWGFGDFLIRAKQEGRAVFQDNHEIAPGINTIYLGGHAICSQAVKIQTESGPAIITSDDVYTYESLAKGLVARICTTPQQLEQAVKLLVDVAVNENGILLPVHDPILGDLYEAYSDRWLTEASKLSRSAIEDFIRNLNKG
jgi:glyoxylase-like metal-dependent hydrolase (beta-lactamase superfamily II)